MQVALEDRRDAAGNLKNPVADYGADLGAGTLDVGGGSGSADS